jgi:integrase
MLRAGFDVRTVQHWMGHKSLETTMRYLSPAKDVHERLDKVQIAGLRVPSMFDSLEVKVLFTT